MDFLPPGVLATFAHQASLGRRTTGRRRKKRAKARTSSPRKKARRNGKPRHGTKAWMAYIRGKRGKKRR